MDINEGNEIIGRYMAIEIAPYEGIDTPENRCYRGVGYTPEMSSNKLVVYGNSEKQALQRIINVSRYNDDWNWLIPVVKKLLDELWDTTIPHPHDMIYNEVRSALINLEIDPLWESVVQGIVTLNKYKKI